MLGVYFILIMIVPLILMFPIESVTEFSRLIEDVPWYWLLTLAGTLSYPVLFPLWAILIYLGFSGLYQIYFFKKKEMKLFRFVITHAANIALIMLPVILLRAGTIPYVGP
jgi:hypothetical protein